MHQLVSRDGYPKWVIDFQPVSDASAEEQAGGPLAEMPAQLPTSD